MQIQGLGHVHGPQTINAPHAQQPADSTGAATSGPRGDNIHIDQLDISPQADAASRARETGEIRQDRVSEIRNQIASGSYETEEKLDLALSRLLDEIA
jgi:negative regulator of flagellin synthesis FlgM